MSDVLNKFSGTGTGGSKVSAEGSGNPEPVQTNDKGNIPNVDARPSNGTARGTNLLDGAGKIADPAATGDGKSAGTTGTQDSGKVEPAGTVTDPDSWTKESALAEVKKAREEAKSARTKYQESVLKLKEEADARVAAVKADQEALAKKAEEYDALKAKEEDKKRDLNEKVAHREAVAAELKAKLDSQDKSYKDQLAARDAELARYKAESEAQQVVYKERLETELASIPEKYRELANVMVKGAGDSRDALVILHEAKLKNMFEDKAVIVNHSVPGAADGARATNERIQAGKDEARNKMTSSQKIAQGLKGIRSGESNSAFRNR